MPRSTKRTTARRSTKAKGTVKRTPATSGRPARSRPSGRSKPVKRAPARQRVRDLPAQVERGQARRPSRRFAAERLGVPVVDADGNRVGQLTDAEVPMEESIPRVVVGLDKAVQRRFGLEHAAVDIEARLLTKDEDGTVRLLEPLPDILRREGFEV